MTPDEAKALGRFERFDDSASFLAALRQRAALKEAESDDYPDDPSDHDEDLQAALWKLQLQAIAAMEDSE